MRADLHAPGDGVPRCRGTDHQARWAPKALAQANARDAAAAELVRVAAEELCRDVDLARAAQARIQPLRALGLL